MTGRNWHESEKRRAGRLVSLLLALVMAFSLVPVNGLSVSAGQMPAEISSDSREQESQAGEPEPTEEIRAGEPEAAEGSQPGEPEAAEGTQAAASAGESASAARQESTVNGGAEEETAKTAGETQAEGASEAVLETAGEGTEASTEYLTESGDTDSLGQTFRQMNALASLRLLNLSDPAVIDLSALESRAALRTENGVSQYSVDGQKTWTEYSGAVTVKGAGSYGVDILSGSHEVIMENAKITCSGDDSPVAIQFGAFLTLTLNGKNQVTAKSDGAGIRVGEGASLTISEDSAGSLTATGGESGAGIGGIREESAGTIIINGGIVTAQGTYGAGIGGGNYGINFYSGGNGGIVTINRGTVTASTSNGGAAIGGGCTGSGGTVTINGGIVTATGSSTGAGIGGGGRYQSGNGGSGGTVTINGGIVTARSGLGNEVGAAIGGGIGGNGGTVTITGGTVTAQGKTTFSAGIGGGRGGNGAAVTITGGNVKAVGRNGGIGAGYTTSNTANEGSLKDGQGNEVSLVTFTLKDTAESIPVTGIGIAGYGLSDVYTLDEGKLYLYLPQGTAAPEAITANGRIYNKTAEDGVYETHLDITNVAEVTADGGEPVSYGYGTDAPYKDASEALQAAWESVRNAQTATVVLLADIEFSGGALTVGEGMDVSLSSGEKEGGGVYTLSGSAEDSGIFRVDGGSLTVLDGAIENISLSGWGIDAAGGSLTVDNGSVKGAGGIRVAGSASAEIFGGTIEGSGTEGAALLLSANGSVTLFGGTFTGEAYSISLEGQSQAALGGLLAEGYGYFSNKSSKFLEETELENETGLAAADYGSITVAHLPGTVATVTTADDTREYKYAAVGGEAVYTSPAGALQAAWADACAAGGEATVTLYMDVDLGDGSLKVNQQNANVVLNSAKKEDGREYTVSSSNRVNYFSPSPTSSGGVVEVTKGSFTLAGGTLSSKALADGHGIYLDGGTVSMTGGAIQIAGRSGCCGVYIDSRSGGSAVISGGRISTAEASGDYGVSVYKGTVTVSGTADISGYRYGLYIGNGAKAEIFGGTVRGTKNDGGNTPNGVGVYLRSESKLTFTGGSIQGVRYGIYVQDNATAEISGGTVQGDNTGLYLDRDTSETDVPKTVGHAVLSGGTFTGGVAAIQRHSKQSSADRYHLKELLSTKNIGKNYAYYAGTDANTGKLIDNSEVLEGQRLLEIDGYGTVTVAECTHSWVVDDTAVGGGLVCQVCGEKTSALVTLTFMENGESKTELYGDGTGTAGDALKNAWAAAYGKESAVITVLVSIELQETLTVQDRDDITLRMRTGVTVSRAGEDGAISVEGGKFRLESGTVSGVNYGIYISGGALEVAGGTVKASGSGSAGLYVDEGTALLSGGVFSGGENAIAIEESAGQKTGDLLAEGFAYRNTDGEKQWIYEAEGNAISGSCTVLAVPVKITGQPEPAEASYGTDASLKVSAEASGQCGYQWYLRKDGADSPVQGADGAEFSLSGMDAGEYLYYCLVSCDGYAAFSEEASVTIERAEPICAPPVGITAEYGTALSETALSNPDGNTPGTWAWKDGGQTVSGALGEQVYLAVFTPSDQKNYKTAEVSVPVTVTDTQKPSGEISIGRHVWNTLFNYLSFGKFFRDTVSVSITGQDNCDPSPTVEYLLEDSELSEEELDQALKDGQWQEYTGKFTVEPGKYVVYARISDSSGNVKVVSSDGVVMYTDSEAVTKEIRFTKFSGESPSAKLTLNGNTVSQITNKESGQTLMEGADYQTASDGTVTFMASYLDTLSPGSYYLTVSYNPQGIETDQAVDLAETVIGLTVERAVISDISASVASVVRPEAGNPVQAEAAGGTGFSAALSWDCQESLYGFGTAYTATLILTPDGDYQFAKEAAGTEGWEAVLEDGAFILKKTFGATRKEKLTAIVTLPDPQTLDAYCANSAAAAGKLPSAVTYETETGRSVSLGIEWSCRNYDPSVNKENIFDWKVKPGQLDAYDLNGQQAEGSISVTNASSIGVVNTGTNREADYDGTAIDISSLFVLDPNAGSASYSVLGGTGTGQLEGSMLTVTKAGTFEIQLATAPSGAYGGGSASAVLTVNRGSGTGTVRIIGWTYGENAKTPEASSPTNGAGNVSYRYESTDGAGYSGADAPSHAGAYRVTAVFAETDLYRETSASTEFVIEKKAIAAEVTARNKVYDGTRDASVEAVLDTGIAGETLTVSGLSGTFDSAYAGNKKAVSVNTEGAVYGGTAVLSDYTVAIGDTAYADITKRPVTVAAASQEKTYGDSDPELSFWIMEGSLAANDTLTGISLAREPGEDAGEYLITATQAEGANPDYEITFEDGIFTIRKRTAALTWENLSLTYNGAFQKPSAQVENLVPGDDCLVTVSGAERNVGTGYTAVASALSNANYQLPEEASVSFGIQPKEITVEITPGGGVFGEAIVPAEAQLKGVEEADLKEGGVPVTLTYTGTSYGGTAYKGTGVPDQAGIYQAEASIESGNYCLTGPVSAVFEVKKADRQAPEVSVNGESVSGKGDGRIMDVSSSMEYRRDGENGYTPVGEGASEISGLASGTYYVRYRETPNYNASWPAQVMVLAGSRLQVLLPETQEGYTLTASQELLDWHGDVVLSYELLSGYTETNGFGIEVNGKDITENIREDGTFTVNGAEENLTVTVRGIADTQAPQAVLTVKSVGWKTFLNKLTFGLFFKDHVRFTVQAEDAGSGIQKAEYLISGEAFDSETAAGLDSDGGWKEVSLENGAASFDIAEAGTSYVYVRVTDRAGNITVVSADGGVVVYTDASAKTSSISYVKTNGGDAKAEVSLNGNTVKAIYNGTDLIDSANYQVEANGTIAFRGAYLSSLPAGQYTLHIVYSPQGEEYREYPDSEGKDINDKPVETAIPLTVERGRGTGSVSMEGWTYGDDAKAPVPASATNGTGHVSYWYESTDGAGYSSADAPKDAGSYRVTASFEETELYGSFTAQASFVIEKANGGLSLDKMSEERVYGDEGFALEAKWNGDGALTYESSGPDVASVDEKGNVALHNAGEAVITVTLAETANYKGETATVAVTVGRKEDTLTAAQPEYGKVYGDADFAIGYKLESGSAITFTSSDPSAATVDEKGVVHILGAGTTVIRLETEESRNYYAVSKNVIVNVDRKPIAVIADDQIKAYGDVDPELTYRTEAGALAGDDTLAGITVKREAGEDAGSYIITASQEKGENPNYDITFEKGTMTIGARDISGANVVLGDSLTANGTAQTQEVSKVTVTSENGGELEVTYTVSGNQGTEAGTYTMTITGTGNFTGSVTKTFVVAPAGGNGNGSGNGGNGNSSGSGTGTNGSSGSGTGTNGTGSGSLPGTGDQKHTALWVILLIGACGCAAGDLIYRRRKRMK